MRKILIPLFALIALCGCDNPEDFTHPENPKKEVNLTPTPAETTTTQTDGSEATTPDTTTPPSNNAARDNSPTKSADATGISGTFDKLNIAAALQADITVGQPSKVSVDCSQQSFDRIKFSCVDGTLNIVTDKDFSAATAKISISMPALVALNSSQSGLVNVTGVDGTNLAVNVKDMSSVDISGNVDNVDVTIADSCLVKMKNLKAKTGTVSSSGRSVLEVRCTDKVIATSSGDSVITVFGMPRKVTKNRTDKSIINLGVE